MNRLLGTYTDKYFISTAKRESSFGFGEIYFETIIREWDDEKRKSGKIIDIIEHSSFEDFAIERHLEIIKKLLTDGK
jgi:hypothetical protein